MVVILVWVDDIIIAASDMVLMSEAKQMLQERFRMKDLGRLSYFLGIDFEQGDGFVKMNQRRYLSRVLEGQGLHLLSRSLSLVVKQL